MRLYLVEGTITHADKMTDDIMSEHKKYTQKWMDEEPFFCHDIQTYTIQPIDVHYMNENLSNWLK